MGTKHRRISTDLKMKYVVTKIKNSKYRLNNKSDAIKEKKDLRKYPRIERDKDAKR